MIVVVPRAKTVSAAKRNKHSERRQIDFFRSLCSFQSFLSHVASSCSRESSRTFTWYQTSRPGLARGDWEYVGYVHDVHVMYFRRMLKWTGDLTHGILRRIWRARNKALDGPWFKRKENRHDQSILSMILKVETSEPHDSPSDYRASAVPILQRPRM